MLSPAAAAAARTAALVRERAPALQFFPEHLLLAASLPPPAVRERLTALARAAERAATSLACASILAGHTSESDDYGDVAVWLGPGAAATPADALGAPDTDGLGLARASPVPLGAQLLPVTVNAPAQPAAAVDEFGALVRALGGARCVVAAGAGADVYALLGHVGGGWGGLVGAGTAGE